MAKAKPGKLIFDRENFQSGRMKIKDGLLPVFDQVVVKVDSPQIGADGKPLTDKAGKPIMEKVAKLDKEGKPVYEMRPVMMDDGTQAMTPRLKYLEPKDKGKAVELEDTEYVLKNYGSFFKAI